MRSRKQLCICFAVWLSLLCPAALLPARTGYGAAAWFSGRDITIDPRAAEEAAAALCARPSALGSKFAEGCAAGFKQAQDIFFSNIQRGFGTDEECALAETRFRQGGRQYISNLSGWCVEEFSDIYSRKGCRDAGDIYFSVLSEQGFCPRASAVAPQIQASAAPESVPAVYPLEPEADGFITGQYLAYYKDPGQIFDSPKMGRWPGSRVPSRTGSSAENASGNAAAGKQAQEVKAVEAAAPVPRINPLPEHSQLPEIPAASAQTDKAEITAGRQQGSAGDNTPGDPIPLKITIPQVSGNRQSMPPDPAPAASGDIQGAGQTRAEQPEDTAQAGGSGAVSLDFSRPVVIDSTDNSDTSMNPGQSPDEFYSRFGPAPAMPGARPPASARRTTIRPDPPNIADLSGGIPPVPAVSPRRPELPGQPVQQGSAGRNASSIPPIGRVIAPIVPGAPPEISEGESDDSFDALSAVGLRDTQTPTQRFGSAIPSFAAEQAESGAGGDNGSGGSSRPDGETVYIPPPNITSGRSRGPAGQMGQ
jgi:hypothetical protein